MLLPALCVTRLIWIKFRGDNLVEQPRQLEEVFSQLALEQILVDLVESLQLYAG